MHVAGDRRLTHVLASDTLDLDTRKHGDHLGHVYVSPIAPEQFHGRGVVARAHAPDNVHVIRCVNVRLYSVLCAMIHGFHGQPFSFLYYD
jgi:hypothetical protein